MASSIDIASNALVLIGDNPISSFDDPGAGAQAATNLYQSAKEKLLSEHPWSFALKQQRLSKLSQNPDTLTNFRNAFQLPTDLIRLWSIKSHSNYDIIGSLVYSNENELLATYVFDVDEVNLPPHFVEAFENVLASKFALSVTEDRAKSETFKKISIQSTAQAMAVDSQSRPQQPIIDSPLIDARMGGRSPHRGFF